MSDTLNANGTLTETALPKRASRSRWFFPGFSGVVLAFVLVGFAPSFYLRPLFTTRPLPVYLYVHGVVLTAWFVLVFVQTCLVAAHRTDLHRRLGIAGVFDAGLVVLLSVFVTIKAIARYIAAGVNPAEIQFIVIGDLVSLAVFSTMIVTGVRMRRRPDWHKRIMMASCIIIIGPAIARLERVGLAVPVPVVLLLLLMALVLYDFISLRRLHRATLWSSLVIIVALAAILSVAGTATGQAIVNALQSLL